MLPWYFFAIGAAIFDTAFTLTRKKALMKEHALDFESARSISVALLLLLLMPFVTLNHSWKIVAVIYGLSVISVVGIILMSRAFRHSQISFIYPLVNIRPIFVVSLAYIFLSEAIGLIQIIGIFIILLGAYALESDHHLLDLLEPIKSMFKSKYSLYMISAVFIFSITALADKYIVSNYLDPISFMFLIWIFIAINLNIVHGIKYGFKEVKQCFKETKGLPFIVGFFSIGSSLLYLQALTLAYVSLVTPVIMLSTLFVVLIGGNSLKKRI